ncbi:cytochrome P450 [Archangium sp.]|uniref:cytochrome P450 n=1 Tax=Archangium sp. TaxID=1872627 RepID=UPI002D68CFFD|nr:cytochrome P450 [Archangium sp.]HYO56557.1 cytochrome P450 [Archangium sp.]
MLPPRVPQPKLLQLYQWVYRPIQFMEESTRRYGESFMLQFPNAPPFLFTSNPEVIRQVFTGKPEDLYVGPVNRVLEAMVGKNSLLLLDDQEHIRERRMMTPPFHGERMLAYGLSMRESANRFIDRWPLGKPFTLHEQFQDITLDIILKTVFGLTQGETFEQFRNLFIRMLNLGSRNSVLLMSVLLPPERMLKLLAMGREPIHLGPVKADVSRILPWAQLSHLMKAVDTYLYAEMARRRVEGVEKREDVLSMLMQARDEDGQPMSDQALRDEAITLLAAGHETTATTLSWAIHHVLQHPDVEARLREEIQQVAGAEPLAPEQVNRLEYMGATLNETLRMSPVAPVVGRVLQRPMKIGEWELPAGMAVMPCVYLAQRRPDLWSEPERFNPERFLGKRISPYEYFPFGGGARRCLGMAFATYEMRIIFAELLRRVRLRSGSRSETRVGRRGVTLAPDGGVPVIVESRS